MDNIACQEPLLEGLAEDNISAFVPFGRITVCGSGTLTER